MYSTLHPPRTMLEVFEGLPEGTLCQLINNNLVMSPSPTFEHQDIIMEISRQLSTVVKEKKLGKVVVAPMDVYLDEENVYQPDILFISKDNLNIIKIGKVRGVPDLIIEILSKRTEKYDREDKKAVYEKYGVKEYWIVDPITKSVTGYQLSGNKYKELPSAKGQINSVLLQLQINF